MITGTFSNAHSYRWLLLAALGALPCALACGSEADDDGARAGDAGTGAGATSGRGGAAGKGGTSAASGASGASGSGATSNGGQGGSSGSAGAADAGEGNGAAGHDPGAAGASGGADGEAGAAGSAGESTGGCMTLSTPPALARAARSAGYSGTDQVYATLYDVACTSLDDCVAACVNAGGTDESCTQGSDCPESSSERRCSPPTYWRNVSGALSESADTAQAAVQTQVVIVYHDALILSDFGLNLPDGATVTGIEFSVRKACDGGLCVDESVRVLKDEMPIGAERKLDGAWPTALTAAVYGSAADVWETSWTPDELESPGFGLALTPVYTDVAGNDRAYVDSVHVVVHYTLGCE